MGKGIVFRVFPCDLNVEALPAILGRSHPIAGVQATGLLEVGELYLFTSAKLVQRLPEGIAFLVIGTLDKGDPLFLTALQLGIRFRRAHEVERPSS